MGRLIKAKQEVFSAKELIKTLGNRMAITRAVNEGGLFALGAGFYSTPSIDPYVATVHVVAKYYPKAITSGISALHIHGLSNERTERISVDISGGTPIRNKMIDARRVTPSRLCGIQTMTYFGKLKSTILNVP